MTGLNHKLTLSMWKRALCAWYNYKHAMVLFHHICVNTAPLGQSFQQHLTTVAYTQSATVMPYLCKKIQECEGSQAQVQALVTDCPSHYVKHLTGPVACRCNCTGTHHGCRLGCHSIFLFIVHSLVHRPVLHAHLYKTACTEVIAATILVYI